MQRLSYSHLQARFEVLPRLNGPSEAISPYGENLLNVGNSNFSCIFMRNLSCSCSILSICNTCLFLNYNNDALDMFVLKKFIRSRSNMFYLLVIPNFQ